MKIVYLIGKSSVGKDTIYKKNKRKNQHRAICVVYNKTN